MTGLTLEEQVEEAWRAYEDCREQARAAHEALELMWKSDLGDGASLAASAAASAYFARYPEAPREACFHPRGVSTRAACCHPEPPGMVPGAPLLLEVETRGEGAGQLSIIGRSLSPGMMIELERALPKLEKMELAVDGVCCVCFRPIPARHACLIDPVNDLFAHASCEIGATAARARLLELREMAKGQPPEVVACAEKELGGIRLRGRDE